MPCVSAQGLVRKGLHVRNTVTAQGLEDDYNDMALDATGNIYTAGTSDDVRSKDWIIRKLAAATGALVWEKRFVIDGCILNNVAAIAVDGSGNVAVTGFCASPAVSDLFTARFSGADGSLIWQKRYNGPGNSYDEGVAVRTDAGGNVVIVATSIGSGGNNDIYTAKYSAATGAVLWEKRYNGPANRGDGGSDLKLDSAGNVFVTGYSIKSSGSDYYTVKYAAATGATLWEARYNGGVDTSNHANSIALDASGNAFVTGLSGTSAAGESDMLTLKYDAVTGQQLWTQRLNGTANAADGGMNIATDGAGNAIVLGYVQTSASNTRKERVLVKYSSSTGSLLWDKRETGPGYYDASDVNRLAVDSVGNLLVTGNGYDDQSREIFFTGKYAAASGAPLWENKYTWETGSESFQVRHAGFAIAVDSSGNVIASGISTATTGDTDHYTIKYSAGGSILWSNRADNRYNRNDGPGAVAVDPAGNAISAGYSISSRGDEDIQVWKNDAATGALLWENRYVYGAPGGDDDRAIAVATATNGDVYVAAQSDRANLDPEIYLAKHAAADGAVLWQRRKLPTGASYVFVRDLAVDAAGNAVVTGECRRSATSLDFYTVMYSASGDVVWEQFYSSSTSGGSDTAKAVALDGAGNVIVTGNATVLNGDQEIRTIKYAAANGAKLWERAYNRPGTSTERVTAVATDPQGNAIITGWSSVSGSVDIYTAKYGAAAGDLIWEKIYTAPSKTAQGNAVNTDSDGNVLITGFQRSTRVTPDYDFYTAKYAAASGALLWEQVYNGAFSGDDRGQGVVIDSENQIWITGISETASQVYGLYSARYSGATGAVLGSDSYDGRSPLSELPLLGEHAIAIGGNDRVAVTGPARPSGKDTDVATILFEPQRPRLVLERPAGTPVPAAGVDLGLVFASPPATTATFTLRNTGTATLTISGVSMTGGDAGAFTAGNPSSTSIAVNGTATFGVGLVSTTIGAHAATLRLTSNDPLANPLLVPLTYTIANRNANLASLEVDEGPISPVFSPDGLVYRLTVPFNTGSVRLRPIAEDVNAAVKVNGTAATVPVAIPVGTTTIVTVVTAQDTRVTKNYNLTVTRLPGQFTFNSAADVPVTADGFLTGGYPVNIVLNYPPVSGTILTMVRNTGLTFIDGRFSNLAQGQRVTLSFGGTSYDFVANYFGGTGNDLVLQWANTKLFAWGSNSYGQLGDDSTIRKLVPTGVNGSGVLAGKTITAVAEGYLHSVVLCSDGTLAAWGYNAYGQLGNNSVAPSPVPVAVDQTGALAGKTVVAISAGPFHNLALCSDGSVAAWGYNNYGQLGTGDKQTSKVPVMVKAVGALSGKQVTAVAAAAYSSFALCSDGSLVAWGYNDEGELGDGTTVTTQVPVAVTSSGVLAGKKIASMAAGQYHTLALCTDGTLVSWGYNKYGQLGNNTTNSSQSPVTIGTSGALAGKTVVSVRAGKYHSLALCADGTVAAWGANTQSQLGMAGGGQSVIPVAVNMTAVTTGKTIANIAVGANHCLALLSDGTQAAWGDNGEGQLGNNSTTTSAVPSIVDSSSLGAGMRFMLDATSSASLHNLSMVALPPSMGSSLQSMAALIGDNGKGTINDDDHDGIPNLVEYAFGLNPLENSAGQLPKIGSNRVIQFSQPPGVTGIIYGAESSTTLLPDSWTAIPDTGTGTDHIFIVPADAPKVFLRLKVTRE